MSKSLFCTNREPITSIGIIAINKNSQILMVQRKDSFGYIDFLRGKYDFADEKYIKQLISGMSVAELELLQSSTDFSELWDALWSSGGTGVSQQYQKDYAEAATKYKEFKTNAKLCKILAETKGWAGPEWGFPKGRRQGSESDFATAMREFEEETGISPSKYTFITSTPFEEIFIGTNGLTYKHKYFVARCEESTVNVKTFMQKKEIGYIQWISLNEAGKLIRPESTGLANTLKSLQNFIRTQQ